MVIKRTLLGACFSIVGWASKLIPITWVEPLIHYGLMARVSKESPHAGLKLLLTVDKSVYDLIGPVAVSYGANFHPKKRLTGYVTEIAELAAKGPGPFCDLGCGAGEIAARVSELSESQVYGLDMRPEAISMAKSLYTRDNLTFLVADVTDFSLKVQFRSVILSNVLEHLDHREEFLGNLRIQFPIERLIVRVPNYERDWRVPLKQELGVDYRLDPTHRVEHTSRQLQEELTSAGYKILSLRNSWGELWVEAGAI